MAEVEPGCPVCCLGLSERAYGRLVKAEGAPFDPPKTVGDVLELAVRRRLREIYGLGPMLTGEILLALVNAGFEIGHHHGSGRSS